MEHDSYKQDLALLSHQITKVDENARRMLKIQAMQLKFLQTMHIQFEDDCRARMSLLEGVVLSGDALAPEGALNTRVERLTLPESNAGDKEIDVSRLQSQWAEDMVSSLSAMRASITPAHLRTFASTAGMREAVQAFEQSLSTNFGMLKKANFVLDQSQTQLQDSFKAVETEFRQLNTLISPDIFLARGTGPTTAPPEQASMPESMDSATDCATSKTQHGQSQTAAGTTEQASDQAAISTTGGLTRSNTSEKRLRYSVATDRLRYLNAQGVSHSWYESQDSVYDSALLVASGVSGAEDSFLIVFTLLLNIMLQLAFCMTCTSTAFTEQTLPDTESLERWRYETAHDIANINTIRGTSLASRVCVKDDALSISAGQVDVLRLVDQYLEPSLLHLPYGVIMSIMAAVCWFGYIGQELLRCIRAIMAYASVPRGFGKRLVFVDEAMEQEEPRLIVRHFGTERAVLLVLLSVIRFGIAMFLCISGLTWLRNTISITDLVLNAIALVFVLDTDEVLFHLILSMETRWLMHHLDPLPNTLFKRQRWHRVVDPFLTFGTIAILTIFFFAQHVMDTNKGMKEIRSILCEGNKDFVIARQEGTSRLYFTQTRPPTMSRLVDDNRMQQFDQHVVVSIINAPQYESSINASYFGGMLTGADAVKMITTSKMNDLANAWGGFSHCTDLTAFSDTDSLDVQQRVQILKAQAGAWDATSCEDFRDHCDNAQMAMLRTLCPVVCGCNSLRSGLLLGAAVYGCPEEACARRPEYQNLMESTSCRDLSVTELGQTPAWRRYWVSGWWYVSNDDGPTVGYTRERFLDEATREGCAFVAREPLAMFMCFPAAIFTVRSFCPVACGCQPGGAAQTQEQCPARCSLLAITANTSGN